MADNLTQSFEKSAMSEEELRQTNNEIRKQIIVFILCLFLTIAAFLAVSTEIIPSTFGIPFIILLAIVQLALQLLFFMHLKDKDHGWPIVFMISGMFFAIPTIAALILLIGIVKY